MDMTEIISEMSGLKKRILTSATRRIEVPKFVGFTQTEVVDFLQDQKPDITIEGVSCSADDEDEVLKDLVNELSGKSGIVFCNFRDTVAHISDILKGSGIPHGTFHGDMEQRDREKSLIKFRNGTHRILVATDLAARGLDIPNLHYIIHYQLPLHQAEFTHRNGRTARMNKDGTAYVLLPKGDKVPEYLGSLPEHVFGESEGKHDTEWTTLYVSGGRRDKISKGDIAGLFLKQGGLDKEELGLIEIKQDSAYVAVKKAASDMAVQKTTNTRLKKKKVRIGRT
jgi:superfamily II DNA/RNA helicase